MTSDRCLRVRPLPDFEKNGVWCKSMYRVIVVNKEAILSGIVHVEKDRGMRGAYVEQTVNQKA